PAASTTTRSETGSGSIRAARRRTTATARRTERQLLRRGRRRGRRVDVGVGLRDLQGPGVVEHDLDVDDLADLARRRIDDDLAVLLDDRRPRLVLAEVDGDALRRCEAAAADRDRIAADVGPALRIDVADAELLLLGAANSQRNCVENQGGAAHGATIPYM